MRNQNDSAYRRLQRTSRARAEGDARPQRDPQPSEPGTCVELLDEPLGEVPDESPVDPRLMQPLADPGLPRLDDAHGSGFDHRCLTRHGFDGTGWSDQA